MKDDNRDITLPLFVSISVAIITNISGNYFLSLAQGIHSFISRDLSFLNIPPPQFDVVLFEYTLIGILFSPSTAAQVFMEIYNVIQGFQTSSIEKPFMLMLSFLSLINVLISTRVPSLSMQISLTLGVCYAIFLFVMYLASVVSSLLNNIPLII